VADRADWNARRGPTVEGGGGETAEPWEITYRQYPTSRGRWPVLGRGHVRENEGVCVCVKQELVTSDE
jgi:hypothetical protein